MGLSPLVALAGVACTAGLATDRPRRGPHHAHVALQTATRTANWSLELVKGRRSRGDEELVVSRMVLNALANACGVGTVPIFGAGHHAKRGRDKNGTVPFGQPLQLDLDLLPGEEVRYIETLASRPWQDLMLGRAAAVCHQGDGGLPAAVFPGAFHPLHAGHRRMMEIARDILGVPVAVEISILNVDKPPLDYTEIEGRVAQFPPDQAIWLTRAATFEEKSREFPRAVFLVGIDTLRRIAAWEYYGGDRRACLAALEDIAARGCRFLVFGRTVGKTLLRLADLELPDFFRDTCREVPPERFCQDVSSTAIRKSGKA